MGVVLLGVVPASGASELSLRSWRMRDMWGMPSAHAIGTCIGTCICTYIGTMAMMSASEHEQARTLSVHAAWQRRIR